MIVLDGATSQPNRSDGGIAAIGPAAGSAWATLTSASRCGRISAAATPGASAFSRRSSRSTRTPRKSRWRQNRTTPTLNRSPRSTLGTTRRIAY